MTHGGPQFALVHDDQELADAIRMLAELPTTSETPGVAHDKLFDTLIAVARKLQLRQRS